MDLFSQNNLIENIKLEDGELILHHGFLGGNEADKVFNQLKDEVHFSQKQITVYSRTYPEPRLTAWYGDRGASYTYSGITHQPAPWSNCLGGLKNKVEDSTGHRFNALLINLYRDGQDSVSWHSDDEKELGKEPVIASLSLGQSRVFQLKHKTKGTRFEVELHHGSLLVMGAGFQTHWIHQVPKTKKPCKERMNLTFRKIIDVY